MVIYINSLINNIWMIPLTLAISLQGRWDIIGPSPLRGEGWERVKNNYYSETGYRSSN
jgi:hypothetical protein